MGANFFMHCGEDNPPVKPDNGADTSPPVPTTPALGAPRPATFNDYIPLSNVFTSPFKSNYQVVENPVSSVANQLVRESSNEGLFQQGTGPSTAAAGAAQLAGDVPFLHSGPFTFRTQMNIENFIDDNYFGTPTHARVSWLRNYTPGFTMAFNPSGPVTGSAFYNITLHQFSSGVERNYYDEAAGAVIRVPHLGIDGLSFAISDLYNQTGNTIINPLASTADLNTLEFKIGTRYETNSLPVSFRYATGPLTLEAVYSNDLTHYFAHVNDIGNVEQHTGTLRGSYDVTPGHLTVFGETSFQFSRYPYAFEKDFDYFNMFVGLRGKFEDLSYQVKTGGSTFETLTSRTTIGRPLLDAQVKYDITSHVSFTAFGDRSLTAGIQTGADRQDAYGSVFEIHPMLRGLLTLSHVWQNTSRGNGSTDRIQTTELGYRHKILGWMEPRLGMKYSLEALSSPKNDTRWTGLAGIAFKLQPRMSADLDYYHEDLLGHLHREITDRWSGGFNYILTHYATATFGLDHAFRRDTLLHGNVTIDELRFGFKLAW